VSFALYKPSQTGEEGVVGCGERRQVVVGRAEDEAVVARERHSNAANSAVCGRRVSCRVQGVEAIRPVGVGARCGGPGERKGALTGGASAQVWREVVEVCSVVCCAFLSAAAASS